MVELHNHDIISIVGMDNIQISKVCGLCAGCKNAIETAEKQVQFSRVALFKEIVHNKNVNKKLTNLGIRTIEDLKDASKDECVILRAHGEPPESYDFITKNNLKFVDCTCPNVTKIHELVNEFSNNGYKIIIIGKYGKSNGKIHPEILGTIGWCKSEPILIEDEEDLQKINPAIGEKLYLVCQTTFNEAKADLLIQKIKSICKDQKAELIINKSICNAQKMINIFSSELAKECDVMIVVGGKNSSNSIELFNNIKNITNAIFIEDIFDWEKELNRNNIKISKDTKIGITAGASTLKEELVTLKNLIKRRKETL